MGSEEPEAIAADGEGPQREVCVSEFLIDATTVTNDDFARFVIATGHVTDAERIGWSYVFHLARSPASKAVSTSGHRTPWWVPVEGACWKAPGGAGSSLRKMGDHPVVHASWNDAAAYAQWAGKRLPSEAEWEMAARGGLSAQRYPWGDELLPADGIHRCNVWQGSFPWEDRGEDGFHGLAPARSFEPNAFGLYNVIGNVWEWCSDWWSTRWHVEERAETRTDPRGPPEGPGKVIRGGSHLCHASYCNRYRLSARTFSAVDMSASHTGFRCAADVG